MGTSTAQVTGSELGSEPLAGMRIAWATMETRLVVLGGKPKPSPREINEAIATLASLHARSNGPVEAGDEAGEGDVILDFDLSLRSQGADPFRVKGKQVLHGILTEYGLPDAAHEIGTALLNMVRPIKTRAQELVTGNANRGTTGPQTAAEGDVTPRPRETPAQ